MTPVEPVQAIELFGPLSSELLAVLRLLQPADWARPTICAPWTVKDVVAHLLGGNLGRLWNRPRTSAFPSASRLGFDELVELINHNNEQWVQAARRISPELLIEFLELTDRHLVEHFRCLDLDAPARITVAWASESLPANWFDIAREYTEKWLHQQQIRGAVGQPLLTGRYWLHPVLDTFLRGLPRTFQAVNAADGTSVTIQIAGEAGGEWTLWRDSAGWQLFTGAGTAAASTVRIDQDLAWRLFTRGLSAVDVPSQVQITGDMALGGTVLNLVAIMA